MAPLPKRRHSTQRSDKRRAARALNPVHLVNCPNCGQPKKPHTVCPACGQYNKRIIIPSKDENHH